MKFEEEMHNKIMEDKTDFNTSITKDQFEDILKKFKERNKRSYDFITKAGEDFQDSMFMLCKRMIGEECFPTRFEKTTLHNLWKRKRSREDLNNHLTPKRLAPKASRIDNSRPNERGHL